MKFEKFEKESWSLNEWQNICPELTYKVCKPSELPNWFPKSLKDKFNCCSIASSGNTETYVGIIMGYRIDKLDIDEHPYVISFDKRTGYSFGGFIHDGHWELRTTQIPTEMMKSINISDFTAEYQFFRKPLSKEGTFDDLKKQDILNGYEKSVEIVERRKLLIYK